MAEQNDKVDILEQKLKNDSCEVILVIFRQLF